MVLQPDAADLWRHIYLDALGWMGATQVGVADARQQISSFKAWAGAQELFSHKRPKRAIGALRAWNQDAFPAFVDHK